MRGQRVKLRHDADHSIVHRQIEITAMFSKETSTLGCIGTNQIGKVKCVCGARVRGQRGSSATMNESRERECCRCDYVQTRCVNESCVWHVNGTEITICGQWPAGFVYAQVHKNNQQTIGRALGKGSGSLPQSSTLVNVLARCHSLKRWRASQTVTSLN